MGKKTRTSTKSAVVLTLVDGHLAGYWQVVTNKIMMATISLWVIEDIANLSTLERVRLIPAGQGGVRKKEREVLRDTKVVELLLKLWDRYGTSTKLEGKNVLELVVDERVAFLKTHQAWTHGLRVVVLAAKTSDDRNIGLVVALSPKSGGKAASGSFCTIASISEFSTTSIEFRRL